jgi:hypothetical protein
MSKEAYSSKFKVGHYTCTMTFVSSACRFECAWDPHEPPQKSLSKAAIAEYRAGRDALLAEVAREIGTVLVIDI